MSTAVTDSATYNDDYGLGMDPGIARVVAGRLALQSCALWPDAEADAGTRAGAAGDTDLDGAQERKLRTVAGLAGVRPGMDVLDVGCGSGGMLDHLVRSAGARTAHGIEPSAAACAEIRHRGTPGTTVDCLGFADFHAEGRFDAVVSVSVLDVVASLAEEAGQEVAAMREFFRRAHGWTRPGAYFGAETVITGPALGTESLWPAEGPGAVAWEESGEVPPLHDVLAAADGLWEPLSVRTHRADWARTADAWVARARAARDAIDARWGTGTADEHAEFLTAWGDMFRTGRLSVAFLSLRRVDGGPGA